MAYLEQSIDPNLAIERFPFLENEIWLAIIVGIFIFFVYWVHIKFIQRIADILDSLIEKNGKSQIS